MYPLTPSLPNRLESQQVHSEARGGRSAVRAHRLGVSVFAALLLAAAVRPAHAQSPLGELSPGRAGVEALDAGRLDEAGHWFEVAAARMPTEPSGHVGLALVRMLQGRFDDARTSLDRALRIDSKNVAARILLGRLQRRTGDPQGAVRTYTALVADAPALTEVARTLDRWNREDDLHSRMDVAVGSHFSVAFEGPADAAVANRALVALEHAYDTVGDRLSVFPVVPVPVVLYTKQQFRDITRSPGWAGGAYDGTIRVPMGGALDQGGELDRVLTHEFVHALVATLTLREVPRWFEEGLAGALERDDLSWAQDAVTAYGTPVPLSELAGPFDRLSGDEAVVAYGTSALVMRRLLDEVGGMAIANLLRDVDDGVPFPAAFAHRMQRTLAEFEASLR